MKLTPRWYGRIVSLLCAVLIALGLACTHSPSIAVTPRSLNLSHGINFSHWFCIPADGTQINTAYLNQWIAEPEIEAVAKMGFKHIRMPIDPNVLQLNAKQGDFQVDEARLQYLDRTIAYSQKYQLDLILDIHPPSKLNLESGIESTDYKQLSRLWNTLSHRYKSASKRIAYEILNEPQVDNPDRWNTIAQALVNEIRQQDTTHPIIVPAPGYSGVPELMSFYPIQGNKIIYTFHFYTPLTFTHQGASWVKHYEELLNVPYPFDTRNAEEVLSNGGSQTPPETKKLLEDYTMSQFGRNQIAAELNQVAQWRDRYQVELYCGEYGAHIRAPLSDRYRWHQDVTDLLKQNGFGSALWAYRGYFGVIPEGQDEVDRSLLQAIGLKPKPI
jgi:endoglucanase